MSTTVKINIADATAAQLRWYANVVLGLDNVKKGTASSIIIGRIHALKPGVVEIDVPDDIADDSAAEPVMAKGMSLGDVDMSRVPAGREGQHPKYDPKVTLSIGRTNDKRRAKRVFVTCNGHVIEIQRGEDVKIPYRHYLVMANAIEKVSIELDEINPVTGLPMREWVEQPSYDFNVKAMPTQEEINAWFERTKDAIL